MVLWFWGLLLMAILCAKLLVIKSVSSEWFHFPSTKLFIRCYLMLNLRLSFLIAVMEMSQVLEYFQLLKTFSIIPLILLMNKLRHRNHNWQGKDCYSGLFFSQFFFHFTKLCSFFQYMHYRSIMNFELMCFFSK